MQNENGPYSVQVLNLICNLCDWREKSNEQRTFMLRHVSVNSQCTIVYMQSLFYYFFFGLFLFLQAAA